MCVCVWYVCVCACVHSCVRVCMCKTENELPFAADLQAVEGSASTAVSYMTINISPALQRRRKGGGWKISEDTETR